MATHSAADFKVVIAGGGIAGLEAVLALRALAGPDLQITMLAADPEFVHRPMRVEEPFAGPLAHHYQLSELAADIGFTLVRGALTEIDAAQRLLIADGGEPLPYDALLLALGARPRPAFAHALTLNDRELDEQMRGVVQDVEGGYARRLAFIAPPRMPWPLPLYELALMTAHRGWEMGEEVSVSVVTPERSPLELFGAAASLAVAEHLREAGIEVFTATTCETPHANEVLLHGAGRTLSVDRVVAMPELFGPQITGLPQLAEHGFIPVDAECRVSGLERVFAAGDATDSSVKFGGFAARQADLAARAIAALAGITVEPESSRPLIHGTLLGGRHPLHLVADLSGAPDALSAASEEPSWTPAGKVSARYLAPYLERRHAERPR